jgi:hypothetical protein
MIDLQIFEALIRQRLNDSGNVATHETVLVAEFPRLGTTRFPRLKTT